MVAYIRSRCSVPVVVVGIVRVEVRVLLAHINHLYVLPIHLVLVDGVSLAHSWLHGHTWSWVGRASRGHNRLSDGVVLFTTVGLALRLLTSRSLDFRKCSLIVRNEVVECRVIDSVFAVHRHGSTNLFVRDDVEQFLRNLVLLLSISFIIDFPAAIFTSGNELNFMPYVFVYSFTNLLTMLHFDGHSDADGVSSLILSFASVLDLLFRTAAKNAHFERKNERNDIGHGHDNSRNDTADNPRYN